MMHTIARLRFLAVLSLVPAVGCSALGLSGTGSRILDIVKPKISIAAVRLAEMPSNRVLASYYCAQYVSPLLCRAFGPVPTTADLSFAFDVELEMANSNSVPLPLVQTLFAFTAFPEAQGKQNLGTVCLSFCEDPNNCKQDANACTSSEPEIRDARDFANAATGFLIARALGEKRFSDLRVRTIPPNDRMKMVVRLGLDPVQMVRLIRELAKGELERVKKGQMPELVIPYEIEGTAWVAVESLGRLATGFGPAAGQWRLERK
ncbi:MAG: hypothetical protein OEV36_02990 [Myxococcales bacterium]|nr:hypothetical protein [Myxococcales bacterium]